MRGQIEKTGRGDGRRAPQQEEMLGWALGIHAALRCERNWMKERKSAGQKREGGGRGEGGKKVDLAVGA